MTLGVIHVSWEAVAGAAACISAIVATLALVMMVCQIRLSNRQSLFDRRLEIWLKAQELKSLYERNARYLDQRDEPVMAIDCCFEFLTNTALLQEITPAIHHVLEHDYQLKLHLKLDEMRLLSQEARYAFKGKASVSISSFVFDYQALLYAMYQYQIVINKMKEASQDHRLTLEDSSILVGEESYRYCLFEAEEKLASSHGELLRYGMIGRIERQVRLVSSPGDYLNTFKQR